MTLEPKIICKTWYQVTIIDVTYGFAQRLINGKWTNTTEKPTRWEDEVVCFSKFFNTYEDAEKFINTKAFKSVFKALEKNFNTNPKK
jgi:hypothetical protein